MPDIVAIGECLIELSSDKPIVTSTSLSFQNLSQVTQSTSLWQLVVSVTVLATSPVSQTTHSRNIFWENRRKNLIDCSEVKSVNVFNDMHFVSRLPFGEREFIYYKGRSAASAMQPSDINPRYIASARLLHNQ